MVREVNLRVEKDCFILFNSTYFSDDLYVVYDKLGDGCIVDFPIKLESKIIKWSSSLHF